MTVATPVETVNIGILAHVDAGKTTLTERLLFDTSTIERLGSVDEGTTQTDSDEVERRRGITIRAAVASFRYGSLGVNLIDTPGHAEFIAEVERALSVLDGAVLVVSAVEGVQAQTRILMRTLRSLGLPTLIFVNKIDRMGARTDAVVAEIREVLSVRTVALNRVVEPGSSQARIVSATDDPSGRSVIAEALADDDERLFAALVAGRIPRPAELWYRLGRQVGSGAVCPVVFGSARSGQGVEDILAAIHRLLPRAAVSDRVKPRGTVFAIERGDDGEQIGYLRLFDGRVRERDRLVWHRPGTDGVETYRGVVSGLHVVGDRGTDELRAGNIARIRGIPGLRIGDSLGGVDADRTAAQFPRPTQESVVFPRDPRMAARLYSALVELAEQDPLISTRPLSDGRTSIVLYGEVQKEIIAEKLRTRFGIDAGFDRAQIVHLERPVGVGSALVELGRSPFVAGIGLRVQPAPKGTGLRYVREAPKGALPRAFRVAIRETVMATLREGLSGWPVTDCEVVLYHGAFDNACSTGGDYRNLTPVVVMRALAKARTAVFEPCHAFEVEIPADTLAPVISMLSRGEATVSATEPGGRSWRVTGEIPVRQISQCKRELPGLTRGEGVWWSRSEGDRPLRGDTPERPRTSGNPLNTAEYMRNLILRRR